MAIGDTARLLAQLDLKDNFSGPIKGITNSLGGFESRFSRIGRGVGQVAGGIDRLATRAGIAAAGGLAAVVTTAASFEAAFTNIEKTVDETANTTFPELEAALRSMARTIPVSFEELAGIGAAGGALGIAADDILDFTDVVARLAVSTNLSSDQAATALGQLGNVLHLRGQDFRDFSDSLVALGNAGASTEDQIVEMAARFGAAGNSAGLTKEEILALSSAVASMGVNVEAGGSSLSRIFSSVATNIGTSSSKAVAFAKVLGDSAAEFRRDWQRDALGTFQEFLTELSKLDQFEQANVLKDIGITNIRDVNAVRLMAQNVGFVGDQLKIANNAQGALNEESQKFFDTTQGQWKTLVNNVRDVGVTIGNEVLPVAKELIEEFTTFLNLDTTKAGLKDFGKDLASGIRSVVTELKGTDFSGLIDGMKLAASVAKGAFDAFRALPQPIQQLAIAALVANKVSGGAVGQIAKGLGNIAGGLLTGGVKGGVGGILGGRGSTPLNPLFVQMVGGLPGGLPGGGPAGIPGVGGKPTFLGNALRVTVIGAVALEGAKTAFDVVNINDPSHQNLVDPTRGMRGTNDLLERLVDLERSASILREKAAAGDQFAARQLVNVEKAIAELNGTTKTVDDSLGDIKTVFSQRLAGVRIETMRAAQRAHETRLATDRGFQKTAAIMESEKTILRDVSRSTANTDRGTRDNNRAIYGTARGTQNHLAIMQGLERRTGDQVSIVARKNFSPTVNVTTNVSTAVSVNDVIRSITHSQTAIGSGPGGLPDPTGAI